MKDIHICMATDENYAPYCGVVITSAMKHKAPDEILHFYILYQDMTETSKNNLKGLSSEGCKVELVDTYENTYTKVLNNMPLPKGAHTTSETYFRILIPNIFSNLDRVLYLDCDILIQGSLAEFFKMDMQGKLLAMVREYEYTGKRRVYFNAGVALIDCKKWREEKITEYLFVFVHNSDDEIAHDQDLINFALNDQIFPVEYKWNRQIRLGGQNDFYGKQDNIVFHFIDYAKPWHGVFQNELVDEYFQYLYELPWDIKDNRERNRSMDACKYYQCIVSLRCLIADGAIHKKTKLMIIENPDAFLEYEYAATDLGFLHVSRTKLEEISEMCGPDSYFLLDSFYDAEAKKVLDEKGYNIGRDYSFIRLLEHNEIEQKIRQRPESVGMKGIRAAIYGTGEWAQKCTEVLARHGANILCYIDSNGNKEGQIFCGKEIISPSKLADRDNEVEMILLASSCHREMKETLLALGIKLDKIMEFDFMKK